MGKHTTGGNTMGILEQHIAVLDAAQDAVERWSVEYPGHGIGSKDALYIGAEGVIDAGLARDRDEAIDMQIEARRFYADARRLMATVA
jgi:hypothetical protein